ncbi:tyrosine-protein phosphatase [Nocardia cyriacigeorgica]|uniref:Tyrosine-protein phosphatase n=1 Tax=Nocardia cyriacigeorgica TaxID=135487 RepID=A0A6P1DFG0_9NOCA|nr:tyrosine-protein phosphatase [Nocardia cyriacigeorgica]NEW47323.1 tyrosine-protein phosphatase [Nocardia cyriacigeorgica]
MVNRSTTAGHRLRVPVALVAGAAIAFGPAAGTAPADPPVASGTVAFDRSLHLEGARNARDLGGYRTVDGRTVRTGLVFRTDQLDHLTPADLAELTRRNVRDVDDLRTVYERALAPDRIPEGARANWYDVIGGAPLPDLVSSLAGGGDMYRAFITTPGANAAFAAVMRDVIENAQAEDGGAVMFHCTAGKDRTGWTAAVLLTILGVDRATVTEDYLLSNEYRGAAPGDLLNGVEASWLDAAFDQAIAEYGSFDNYVRTGLGLTDAEIATLKARVLA